MNLNSRVIIVIGALALILAPISKKSVIASEANGPAQIRTLLQNQTEAWNRGDIDAFMAGSGSPTRLPLSARAGSRAGGSRCWSGIRKTILIAKRWGNLRFRRLKSMWSARMRPSRLVSFSWSAKAINPQEFLR